MLGVGVGLSRGQGVGVGFFCPTPTPETQLFFLKAWPVYIYLMYKVKMWTP